MKQTIFNLTGVPILALCLIFNRVNLLRRLKFSALKTGYAGLANTLLACTLLLLFEGAVAAPFRLTLVLSEAGGAYREYSEALAAELVNKSVTLQVIEAGNSLPEADLFIAAGMKAAATIARQPSSAKLAVLVPREGFNKLLNEVTAPTKAAASNYSAIYLDQPYKRQLDLITAALPHVKSIGVLYAQPPKELNVLRHLMAIRKIVLHERSSVDGANLHQNLHTILLSSDVLLAMPDAEIYNASTIRNILLASYRNKVPLIGFSPAYVKAGALCAVYSTPAQIAKQSLAFIQEFITTGILLGAQAPREFEVLINEQVAHSLGLNIKSTSQLRSDIGAGP